MPKSYRITILNGPDRGKTYYLTSPGTYAFGRAPTNHIVLEGSVVSKVHGEFIRDDEGLIIRDAGSRNGCILHGKRLNGDYRVTDRCGVQVGRYKLKIEPTDETDDPASTRAPIEDDPEDKESHTPATGDQPFNSLATMPVSSEPAIRTTRALTPRNAGTTRKTGTGSGTGSRSGSSGAGSPTTGKGDYGAATRDEILFGRVVEGLGFVAMDMVDEAVRFQEEGGAHKLLGQVMLQMELIDQDQLDEVIRTQRENWNKIDIATGRPRSEILFGVLAVKLGCCQQRDVNFAVRAQAKAERDGISVQLGRILVQRKSITEEDAKRIGQAQGERHPVSPIPGYEFIAKLGQGGMGTVYKGRQISLDRIVAIKVLPLRLAQDDKYVQRFLREARAVAKLNHVNIVGGIDAGTIDGNHFFVMEYVDGPTVKAMLKKREVLPEPTALKIAMKVAEALEHASKHSIVHRDVKPDNIMMTKDGTVKLCDLGLAKSPTWESSVTQTGGCIGTPDYMPPEQINGDAEIDVRTDIYSLGATLYHMVVGRAPFPAPTPIAIMTRHLADPVEFPADAPMPVSPFTQALIKRMMEKSPELRPQSAVMVVDEIRSVLRKLG